MYRLVLRSFAIAAAAGLLAACSSMPEWTKPTTWYDGVTGEKKPDEEKTAAKPAPAPADATTDVAKTDTSLPPVVDPLEPAPTGPRIKPSDKPTEFPNVSAQPEPREATTTDAQRHEIRDSLVADRDRAQHTADELRGGTTPAAAPPPPAAKPAAAPATATKDEDKPAEDKPAGN